MRACLGPSPPASPSSPSRGRTAAPRHHGQLVHVGVLDRLVARQRGSARARTRPAARPAVHRSACSAPSRSRSPAASPAVRRATCTGSKRHAPRLAGVLAHLECTPWRSYAAGDHTLFLGEVTGFDFRDGDALAFLTSRFTILAEEQLGQEHLI
ncbi:MAG: flavin reductase family protein [Solirubrobacterales bacterium]